MATQKNVLILIGILGLSYMIILLLSPKDITDYTIADTEYWGGTNNRLLLKTAYDYNNKDNVLLFPQTIGEWKSFNYRYPDYVYNVLNAEIMLSRGYTKDNKNIIWMDIINSKTGESFHKQRICIKGAGWNIDNESIVEFNMVDNSNSFAKLYANRLDISKGDKRQVMVYWFMFKKFGYNDSVTMIRLSSTIHNNTEETFGLMKKFIEGQLFYKMYNGTKEDEITTAEYIIDEYGDSGKIAIMVSILIPLGMVFIGIRNGNKDKK